MRLEKNTNQNSTKRIGHVFIWVSCFALALMLTPRPLLGQTGIELPETQAGKRMSQLVEAINCGDEQLRLEILTDAFPGEKNKIKLFLKHTGELNQEMGTLQIVAVPKSEENMIRVEFATSKGPNILLSLENADSEPFGIQEVEMDIKVDDEDVNSSSPLTSEQQAETIAAIASKLRASYVYPKVGDKMAAAVESSLKNGDYKELTDRRDFCDSLTDQLRGICNDKHLGLGVLPPKTEGSEPVRHRFGAINHGFKKVEYVSGKIGYLKFDFFSGEQEAEQVAAAAMTFLADSEALIVDLRENGGGSPEMIAFLTTYFYDEGQKVHLNSFYNRPSDETTESWIRETVPGKRLGKDLPVFVLTSNFTFSGAEEFAYNLKHLKRAKVIGEVTGGGAHPVRGENVKNGIGLRVPFARAINPVTKTNWEGTGVQPHKVTDADSALESALKMAQEIVNQDDED